MKRELFLSPLAVGLLVLTMGATVAAAAEGGSLEAYGGIFSPDDLSETTYGLRAGIRPSPRLGVELSAGYFQIEGVVDFTPVDLSLAAVFERGKSELLVFGGIGWAFANAGPFGNGDSATAHVGLAAAFRLTDSVYLRPDVRERWFEDGGDTELEATLALGLRLGQ